MRLGIFCLLLLAGCETVGQRDIEGGVSTVVKVGYTQILPTTDVRVGRLYFSGTGRRPAFATADGTIYNNLCYDDFALTKGLKDIEKFIVDEGITTRKTTISVGLSGGAAVSASKIKALGNLTAGAEVTRNRVLELENVRTLSFSDAGIAMVRAEINDNCWRDIANLKKSSNVILLLSAQRAERATEKTVDKIAGKAGVAVKGIAGVDVEGEKNSGVSTEYDLLYISMSPDSFS